MFLATKNAANISMLKGQIDEITSLKQLVKDLLVVRLHSIATTLSKS